MRAVVVLVGTLVVSACDGKEAAPVAPTPTVTQVALSQTVDVLFINEVRDFVLTATYSDGAARVASATWSSDAPAAATVSPTGQVQGKAAGEATIIAAFQGRQVTHRVRVMPEYAGRWEGAWREIACDATGAWRSVCDTPDSGSLWSIDMDLNQNRETVSGRIAPFIDLSFSTTGSVAMDGALSQQGTTSFEDGGFRFTLDLFDWVSRSTTNQAMTGGFKVRYSSRDFSGEMVLTMELVDARKVGIVPAGAARSGSALRRPALRLPMVGLR